MVEACRGGGKGKGRERSGVGGGRGVKKRGPWDASGGARDGGLNTEETGKRKRQSSEKFMEMRGNGGANGEQEQGGTGARDGGDRGHAPAREDEGRRRAGF